jgi:hypothetical protein
MLLVEKEGEEMRRERKRNKKRSVERIRRTVILCVCRL